MEKLRDLSHQRKGTEDGLASPYLVTPNVRSVTYPRNASLDNCVHILPQPRSQLYPLRQWWLALRPVNRTDKGYRNCHA